jgi:hypothetical protein
VIVTIESVRWVSAILVSDIDSRIGNLERRNISSRYVFLYYTQAPTEDGDDRLQGKEPLGNRLYRYELVNDRLVNPKLLLDLPGTPGQAHDGGALRIGPYNSLYLAIVDVQGEKSRRKRRE